MKPAEVSQPRLFLDFGRLPDVSLPHALRLAAFRGSRKFSIRTLLQISVISRNGCGSQTLYGEARAVSIDEKRHDTDHPTVAIRLNNIALLLRATRHGEAEPLFRRALAILERLGRTRASRRGKGPKKSF
jgi:Tetratricopeptide repeat